MGVGRGKGAMTTLLFVEGKKKETHVFFLTFLILIFF